MDVDAIGTDFRLHHRRMSMDDDLAERLFVEQKILSDPEQIRFALLPKRNARTHAGMYEEIVAARERGGEAVEKSTMEFGQRAFERRRKLELLALVGIDRGFEAVR